MNDIPTKQNERHQLAQLGAYSQIYNQAKLRLGINMLLSVPVALIWAIAIAALPKLNLGIYAAVWGVAVTLFGILYLTPSQKDLQTKAAKIQQLFDCELLEIKWQDFNIDRPPSKEMLFEANAAYIKTNPTYKGLVDWYPTPIDKLPLPLARLICQRANCWWDGEQRRRYATGIVTVLVILAALVLLIGLTQGLTLEKFCLTVALPLAPALNLGITEYHENIQAATTLDELRRKAEDTWDRALSQKETPQTLYDYSVKLQDAIFDNRSRSPLIFNWFYQLFRDKREVSMTEAAKTFVSQATQSIAPSP